MPKKIIGVGSESAIYELNGEALKILNNPTLNKLEKIKILKKLTIKNFILPKDIVYNNEFVGYTMKYIKNGLLLDNQINKLKNLKEKIELLKKQEYLIKEAHKNEIIMVDLNPKNFIVKDDKLYAIDTDNYLVGDIPNDINPTLFYEYYNSKVNNIITKDIDIMSYTLYLLFFLTENKYKKNEMIYYDENDYIENYINNLIIPKETKELFKEIVSDSINKPYIDNNLEILENNEPYIKSML